MVGKYFFLYALVKILLSESYQTKFNQKCKFFGVISAWIIYWIFFRYLETPEESRRSIRYKLNCIIFLSLIVWVVSSNRKEPLPLATQTSIFQIKLNPFKRSVQVKKKILTFHFFIENKKVYNNQKNNIKYFSYCFQIKVLNFQVAMAI